MDTNDGIVSDESGTNDEVVSDEVGTSDGVVREETDINHEVVSEEIDTNDEADADSSIEEVENEVVVGGEMDIDCGDQSAPSAGSCNEDYTNAKVVSKKTDMNDDVTADSSIEVVVDGELESDCSDQSDASAGACDVHEESLAGENDEKASSSEESITDCIDTGDVSNEENNEAAEEVEIPETDQENQNEKEDVDIDSDREDDQKTDTDDSEVNGEQNPTDESPHQPDSTDETTESGVVTSTDEDFPTAETLEISVD